MEIIGDGIQNPLRILRIVDMLIGVEIGVTHSKFRKRFVSSLHRDFIGDEPGGFLTGDLSPWVKILSGEDAFRLAIQC